MRHLLITMRHSVSESHKCRLIMLSLIVVSMKSLRGLNLKNFNEYISIQHAPVIEFFKY